MYGVSFFLCLFFGCLNLNLMCFFMLILCGWVVNFGMVCGIIRFVIFCVRWRRVIFVFFIILMLDCLVLWGWCRWCGLCILMICNLIWWVSIMIFVWILRICVGVWWMWCLCWCCFGCCCLMSCVNCLNGMICCWCVRVFVWVCFWLCLSSGEWCLWWWG